MPKGATSRTRLAPDDRRDQILEAAMREFGERGYADVSASDIARAAGVTPALITHYFGPKREIYLAVVRRFGATVMELGELAGDAPMIERLRHNLGAWMDWVEANSALWLATAGLGDTISDPEIFAIVSLGRERAAERILETYADLVDDTPVARAALLSWMGLNQTALRRWLRGEATREQTHELLVLSLQAMLVHVIPELTGAKA